MRFTPESLLRRFWQTCVALLPAAALCAPPQYASEWFTPAPSASPVARPFDPWLLNPKGHEQSADVLSAASAAALPEGGTALVWETRLSQTASASGKSWATLRVSLPKHAAQLGGIRLVFDASAAGELRVEFFSGVNANGFWPAKREASQTLPIQAGENDLRVEYSGTNPVSGFGLVLTQFPQTLSFKRTDFLFRSVDEKRAYDGACKRLRRERYDVMLQWLAARGVSLTFSASAMTPEDERALWTAAQLLAMGEQADYGLRLCGLDPAAEKLRGEGAALAQQTRALREAGQTTKAGEWLQKTQALQTRLDAWSDAVLAAVPPERRRWNPSREANTFTQPDGRPYRMFGPAYFRTIYHPKKDFGSSLKIPSSWDMRYLAALGFNGARLMVEWGDLEPTQGTFDPEYVAMLKDIMAQAERYGVGISFDLHWPYPAWFMQGKPNYTVGKKSADKHNSYHWGEALAQAWGRIGETFKDVPNIVAFEVPTNETSLARTQRGVLAYPYLNRLWNRWLRQTYGTREALARAWDVPSVDGAAYALAPDESWETDSIRPLGFQKDATPAHAYAHNPRFWDHVRWAAWMQETATDAIMQALRVSIPDAEGMMQYTIGDVWDNSPVPVNYKAISTLYGEHVLPGTHYGMGGIDARKAASFTLKSYDSEQQMENRENQVSRHLDLGLGFCPFSFHARGGGGMLFVDDDWYLKREVAHLPLAAERIRNAWPEKCDLPKVAYIQNTRRAAVSDDTFGDLPAMVAANGWALGVFEGLRIVKEPRLLDGYAAVILDAAQLDGALLDVLLSGYKGRVLLYGSLAQDAYTRTGSHSSAAALARAGVLLSGDAAQKNASSGAYIDLSGEWDWRYVGEKKGAPARPPSLAGEWQKKTVPGTWGEETILGSLQFKIGDAWYRRTVEIPADWKDRSLNLEIGAIDDIDWVFFNGKRIGHTGDDRANWWEAPRNYPIPKECVRWGAANEIFICVRNTADDAGITKSPVRIASGDALESVWKNGERIPLRIASDADFLAPEVVAKNTQILARIARNGGGGVSPALIRDGNRYWWVGGLPWSLKDKGNAAVLKTFLSHE